MKEPRGIIILLRCPRNCTNSSSQYPPKAKNSLTQELIDDYRWTIANISWDLMLLDTNHAAQDSLTMDISPLVEIIEHALDEIGMYGVYESLFRQHIYADTITQVAHARGVAEFTSVVGPPGKHASSEVFGHDEHIPNDRANYPLLNKDDETWNMMGGWWWNAHWVGAITANKLLRDGHLWLGYSSELISLNHNSTANDDSDTSTTSTHAPQHSRFIYDVVDFFAELRKIQRSTMYDYMQNHAMHGFIWHYMASTRSGILDEYPTDLVHALCPERTHNMKRIDERVMQECQHGFGHGVFYSLILHDLQHKQQLPNNHEPPRPIIHHQFRMDTGLDLSPDSQYLGFQLCDKAPHGEWQANCVSGMLHSRAMFSLGRTPFGRHNSDLMNHYMEQKRNCTGDDS